jgi:hypothetical protein
MMKGLECRLFGGIELIETHATWIIPIEPWAFMDSTVDRVDLARDVRKTLHGFLFQTI